MKTFSPASITIYAVETAGGRNIATDARPRNRSNIAEYGKEHIMPGRPRSISFSARPGG